MAYKTIRNTSKTEVWIMIDGQRFAIKGEDEQSWEDKIADKFLEMHSPVVMDMSMNSANGQTFAPDLIKDTIWVANVTGNPDAVKTVKVRRYDKTILRVNQVDVKNINSEPRPLSEELKGGHEQWFDSAGLVQRTKPSKVLTIPPFSRRPFSAAEARWMLQRDSMNEQPGAMMESRAPTDFEPDMTWKLKDMRAYGRLVDSNMDLGEDDAMLAKRAKEEAWDEKKVAEELRKAKQMMLRRLFFRLVNPAFRLPTRQEFNEFVTGKSEEQIAKEELNELLAATEKQVKSTIPAAATGQRKVG